MIEKLSLTNFQCHRQLEINLDPHITTIVGPSDTGKSAILRALQWVVTNKPSGEAFIHDEAREVLVSLHADGHTVERSKGKKNAYALDDQLFVAFGTSVPDPVSHLLNLSPTNFQGQHDSAFWFSETAGDVSRQLNQIVNLGVIDSTLSNLASALRKARARVEVSEERVQEAKKKRKALKRAKAMERALRKLEKLETKLRDTVLSESLLTRLWASAKEHHRSSLHYTNALEAGLLVCVKGDAWKARSQESLSLAQLVEKGKILEGVIGRSLPDTSPLETKAKRARTLEAQAEDLSSLVEKARGYEETACQRSSDESSARRKLKKLMGKTCPLCDQRIP